MHFHTSLLSLLSFALFFTPLVLGQSDPYNVWKGATICDDASPSLQTIQADFVYQTLELTKSNYFGNFSVIAPGSTPVVQYGGTLNVALKFQSNHFKANTTVNLFGTNYITLIDYILGKNSRFCEVESTYPSMSTPPPIRNGLSFPNGELLYTTQNGQLVSANMHLINNNGTVINGWFMQVDGDGNLVDYWVYQLS